jgi:glc operon protein GlcG
MPVTELSLGRAKNKLMGGMNAAFLSAGGDCMCRLFNWYRSLRSDAPNPDNPNDAIPDSLTPLPYGEPINLETAKKVAVAAIAETKKPNWNAFCVSVVNPSGDLVYFEKQDNCQYASIGISQHKARTAARYRRPTLVFETLIGKGPYFAYLTTLDDVIASRGGNLLIVDGKIIGAIGVSGGSGSQDNVVSLAGQAALKKD